MSALGFHDIEPLGGVRDKGRDAIHISKVTGKTTLFLYSVEHDWEAKFLADLALVKHHGHKCDSVVFVTNQPTPTPRKDALRRRIAESYRWKIDIYDLNRIATLVNTRLEHLKPLHPNIFVLSCGGVGVIDSPLNRRSYAEHVLHAYEEWLERYTPLFADLRYFDTVVIPAEPSLTADPGVPVATIASRHRLAIVVGESGAGKTTALWRVAADYSTAILTGKSETIPILIALRSWTRTLSCRRLVQQAFQSVQASEAAIENELRSGNCLVLIDGLNELPGSAESQHRARIDLQHFLVSYPKNRFVICCRAADYRPSLLDLEQLGPHLPTPKVFEIKRLDDAQVQDYVERQFRGSPADADTLLRVLTRHDEKPGSGGSSVLNLSRTPLFLQVLVATFRATGHLPRNKASLLRAFIERVLDREELRNTAKISRGAKERLLGAVAYRTLEEGHFLQIPALRARSLVADELRRLTRLRHIAPNVTADMALQELLSNNFWRPKGRSDIEWLHQLVLEYFLGCETARIRVDANPEEVSRLNRSITRGVWDQACVVAVSLMGSRDAARFLSDLLTIDPGIAQLIFDNAEDEDELARELIDLGEADAAPQDRLARLARLPYLSVIDRLGGCFRRYDETVRVKLAEAVSQTVIAYLPLVSDPRWTGRRYDQEDLEAIDGVDPDRIRQGIRRAVTLLTAWSGNRNAIVRFYAAKGLWGSDRGRAAQVLKEVLSGDDVSARGLAERLIEEWRID